MAGSIWYPSVLVDMVRNGKLSPFDVMLYIAIKMHMDNESRDCYPGQRKLMKLCGCGSGKISSGVKKLEKLRLLSISHRRFAEEPIPSTIYNFPKFPIESEIEVTFSIAKKVLKNDNLSSAEKELILTTCVMTGGMLTLRVGEGQTARHRKDFCDAIHMHPETFRRLVKSLKKKGYCEDFGVKGLRFCTDQLEENSDFVIGGNDEKIPQNSDTINIFRRIFSVISSVTTLWGKKTPQNSDITIVY